MGFFNKKNNTIEENKNMIDKNVKNYNVLDFSNLLKINNQNLNRILNSVNDESIFSLMKI